MVTWHTQSFRELAAPVADVLGARTAKDLEKLRIHTVGDLLRQDSVTWRFRQGAGATSVDQCARSLGVSGDGAPVG